jgi:hypothetical protein
LDRQDVLTRLRQLLQTPILINQRGLNACGPAVFFRIWLARDPVAAADFACSLLRDGSAKMGSLIVAPSWKLLGQKYATLRSVTDAAHPNATPECTDWMLLSALRDSENIWFDYAGEPFTVGDSVAGLTLPSTLSGWLSSTNLYSTIQNDTNLVASGDLQRLLGLIPTSDVDLVLFINAAAIYDLLPAPAATVPQGNIFVTPNHYVLMTAPFVQGDDPAWIDVDVWSWGRTYAGLQGKAQYISNYFGLITASV